MKEQRCKHEWKEDERFESGAVIMLFGNIGDIKQETRVICQKCGEVDYVTKPNQKEKK